MAEEKRRVIRVHGDGSIEEVSGKTTLEAVDDILDEYNSIRFLDDILGEDDEERRGREEELREDFNRKAAMLK